MKNGKVSESILKRSVLKMCRTKREEVLIGAGLGRDCAVLQFKKDGNKEDKNGSKKDETSDKIVTTMNPVIGSFSGYGKCAVHRAVNNLAAGFAEPVGILLSILLPEGTEEVELKEVMAEVSEECDQLGIEILGGHTEVTDAVLKPVLTVTGIGKLRDGVDMKTKKVRPGQDIVVSKWVAIEGSSILAGERKEELKERYAERFIREAEGFKQYLSVLLEAEIAASFGVSAMHDLSEGGIFGALWEMAAAYGVGLEADLKKIPIRQETVEICNFFDINPYEYKSEGSLLMVTDRGEELVMKLEEAGIPAVIIGKITDNNDKLILNEEEKRYLEPPR